MIKLLKLNKTAWITFFGILIGSFIMITLAYGQETPEEKAQKYGVTFPIAQLGNCGSLSECRNFCEDPLNSSACIAYAKSKGFYQEDKVDTNKEQILARAKEVLGCDSYDSCRSFCSVSSNHDKCDSFANSQGLSGGHVEDPTQAPILAKAKELLGCDSPQACKDYCNQEGNRDKCSDFAKQVGLRGGEAQVGPGGCTSESTCRALCSDPNNFQICKGFQEGVGEQFTGPGGCSSESSCREYCQNNPSSCGHIGGPGASPPPGYNPQEMCNRTPNCAWSGTTCQCTSYDGPGYSPPPGSTTYDPAKECSKYAGCSWTGSTCQCSNYTQPTTQPYPTYSSQPAQQYSPQPNYTPYPQSTSEPTSGTSTGTYDPATECAKTSGCSWTGSSCQCSSSGDSSGGLSPGGSTSTSTESYSPHPESSPTVQGVYAFRSLLEELLNFLSR